MPVIIASQQTGHQGMLSVSRQYVCIHGTELQLVFGLDDCCLIIWSVHLKPERCIFNVGLPGV